jgi:hypothetical protein
MRTLTARVIERETIRETIYEIEERHDDPPIRDDVRVIEIAASIRGLTRRGPAPSRRVGSVERPLLADQRGGR